jgi:hypothetical protein
VTHLAGLRRTRLARSREQTGPTLVGKQTAASKDARVRQCSEMESRGYESLVLYLTFKGLAVHNTEYGSSADRGYCTVRRSPVNPLILPYRDLKSFVIPSPLSDELLKLN